MAESMLLANEEELVDLKAIHPPYGPRPRDNNDSDSSDEDRDMSVATEKSKIVLVSGSRKLERQFDQWLPAIDAKDYNNLFGFRTLWVSTSDGDRALKRMKLEDSPIITHGDNKSLDLI